MTIVATADAKTITSSQSSANERLSDYIDPQIGSEGLGRVFIGPSAPFGMVRPGPDCTPSPNSGWLPMPERVDGFAQVHVSGTGGGPKYGNILIQPFSGNLTATKHHAHRLNEEIKPGYYSTTFEESGITTEITTTPRTTAYRISYPSDTPDKPNSLMIDAGFFLGENPVPDSREAQQFVGSEVQVVSDHEIAGYSRIRGGWNNGRAYTVYFHLSSDTPFSQVATWKGDSITNDPYQYDSGEKTGASCQFSSGIRHHQRQNRHIVHQPTESSQRNLISESEGKDFETIHSELLDSWDDMMNRIKLHPSTPADMKRMFYTAFYHTLIMPSDRSGENPLWTDPGVPYYDDFYALWDTYRTSMPLLAIIDSERLCDIVNSLVNIGKRDGYMPDARSGNANGRTQGDQMQKW